jgi:hypothetical protein
MKGLAFLQPWAYAILSLGKRIDNRRQKNGSMPPVCKHRGPLLIHASAGNGGNAFGAIGPEPGTPVRYFDWSVAWMRERSLWIPTMHDVARGGIVGRCDVVGHIDPDGRFWLDPEGTETDPEIAATLDMRWHMAGSYGLALVNVEPLAFVPWKGALGLFNVPDEYASKARQ